MDKAKDTPEGDPTFVATHPTNPDSPRTVTLREWDTNKMAANGWKREGSRQEPEEETHKKK